MNNSCYQPHVPMYLVAAEVFSGCTVDRFSLIKEQMTNTQLFAGLLSGVIILYDQIDEQQLGLRNRAAESKGGRSCLG